MRRYLDLVPTFGGVTSLPEARRLRQELRASHQALQRQVQGHRGYRHDGSWWTVTRRDRIAEELQALERRIAELTEVRRSRPTGRTAKKGANDPL